MLRIIILVLIIFLFSKSQCQKIHSNQFQDSLATKNIIELVNSERLNRNLNILLESKVLKNWISDLVATANSQSETNNYILIDPTNDSVNNLLFKELTNLPGNNYQIFIENHFESIFVVDLNFCSYVELSKKIIQQIYHTSTYQYLLFSNLLNNWGDKGLISVSTKLNGLKVYVAINVVILGYF